MSKGFLGVAHSLLRTASRPGVIGWIVFALALTSARPVPAALDWYQPWRWQARMLLLFAPREDDPSLLREREILADASVGAAERDVVVVEVVGEHASETRLSGLALRLALHVPADRFTVILIGKDGGEKMRVSQPISAGALFATIDAMPMRKNEALHKP